MNTSDYLRRIEEKIRDKTPLKELGAFVAHLREVAEAEEQASIKPLDEDLRRVLHYIDTANDYVYAKAVSEALKIDASRTEWLLGRLVQSQHIYETPNVPARYKIEQKGRDAVHDPMA
jgi:hypothetical protein